MFIKLNKMYTFWNTPELFFSNDFSPHYFMKFEQYSLSLEWLRTLKYNKNR